MFSWRRVWKQLPSGMWRRVVYLRIRRTVCIRLHLHWRQRQMVPLQRQKTYTRLHSVIYWTAQRYILDCTALYTGLHSVIYWTAQRYIPEESNHHYSKWLADESSWSEFDGRKVQNCCRHSVTLMSRSPTSSATTAFFIWVFSLCAVYNFVVENIRKVATTEEHPK